MVLATSTHEAHGALAPPLEHCPFIPRKMIAIVLTGHSCSPPPDIMIESLPGDHPASTAQVEVQQRISFARSRQKRGPPADILSL